MRQAVEVVGIFGRVALIGISDKSFEIFPYQEIIGKEAKIIGVSDHLSSELPNLLEFAESGKLFASFRKFAMRALMTRQIHTSARRAPADLTCN
jgi:threonine dehydrogenase-like Zn-dependent dehydrogenase